MENSVSALTHEDFNWSPQILRDDIIYMNAVALIICLASYIDSPMNKFLATNIHSDKQTIHQRPKLVVEIIVTEK